MALIRSFPNDRAIKTSSAKPNLASHAPRVSKIIELTPLIELIDIIVSGIVSVIDRINVSNRSKTIKKCLY